MAGDEHQGRKPGNEGHLSERDAGQEAPAADPGDERRDRGSGAAPNAHDPQRRRLLAWLWRVPVLAVLAGVGYALLEGRRIIFGKDPASEVPEFEPRAATTVAPLSRFENDWDAVGFELQEHPAIALRLPAEVAGGVTVGGVNLAAFSRICTHQRCPVSLNTDLEAIAFAFNYRTDTPKLVCPCHLSVFSPLDAGRAVSGPAVRPLPRVQLEVRGEQLVAVGLEEQRQPAR